MSRAGTIVLIAHAVLHGCAFEAGEVFGDDAGPSPAEDPCVLGETRPCGDCGDGVQTCHWVDEFIDWGACEGAGATCAMEPAPDPVPPTDPEPQTDPEPLPEPDPDPCSGPEICRDGIDNDCDYDTDCEDLDCADECAPCFEECLPGQARWCNTSAGCRWGTQTCNPDQTWGACTETGERPVGCEAFARFDTVCCDGAADACCEDWPFDGSVGECTGVVPCWDWP
jgi:hypothetical protein